jgi:hypothetical protein
MLYISTGLWNERFLNHIRAKSASFREIKFNPAYELEPSLLPSHFASW